MTQIGQLEDIGSYDGLGGCSTQDTQLRTMKLKLHVQSDLWTRMERAIRVNFTIAN